MHFLPDVWVECEVCQGARYNPETLAVRYKGKSIADVLNMRVSEALELFDNIPKIRSVLKTLADVGLDYLSLGQSAPTLSGGEAQRVKLAAELARPSTGRTLYLLDEPTTGLHFDDVRKLLDVLNRLVDLGNTVITVEHNLEVIKTADWVIDLGPEAGGAGGNVVAAGTPEDVVAHAKRAMAADGMRSYTGLVLEEALKAGPYETRTRFDPAAALAAQAGDIELEKVGKDAQLPWKVDGRKWHCVDRLTVDGKALPLGRNGTPLGRRADPRAGKLLRNRLERANGRRNRRPEKVAGMVLPCAHRNAMARPAGVPRCQEHVQTGSDSSRQLKLKPLE